MKINIDYILRLHNILKNNQLSEKECKRLLNTKAGRNFLKYENKRINKIGKGNFKKELRRLIEETDYQDLYGVSSIKKNLSQLEKDICYLEDNYKTITDAALKEVYKIVPNHMRVQANIYLYAGGLDGGFTLNRRDIFINYAMYMGKREDFIGILGHELYHCRKILWENRMRFLIDLGFKSKGAMYKIMGKIIEEGIACLVQHGPILETDDLVNGLTRRSLLLRKSQFDILNNILMDIKMGKLNHGTVRQLNIYIVGYYMVSRVYNSEGVLALDCWTEKLEYENIIKNYINICHGNKVSTGFTEEIESWLLDM